MGISFGFRVVALDPNFRKLSIPSIVSDYKRAKRRAILLDYDGTLMPQNSINKAPSQEVMDFLDALCEDEKNTVFIVSGRGRESLGEWFSPCKNVGIAAEHGYFLKYFFLFSRFCILVLNVLVTCLLLIGGQGVKNGKHVARELILVGCR